jgi:ATP-dependent Lon protease
VSHVDEVLARALVAPVSPIDWTEADELAAAPLHPAAAATPTAGLPH